jgi:hypothetical protein
MTYLKSNIVEVFNSIINPFKEDKYEVTVSIDIKEPKKPQPKPVFHNTFVRIGEKCYSIYYSSTTLEVGKNSGAIHNVKYEKPFIYKNNKQVFIKEDIFGNKCLID